MIRFTLHSVFAHALLGVSLAAAADGLMSTSFNAEQVYRLHDNRTASSMSVLPQATALIQNYGAPDTRLSEFILVPSNRIFAPAAIQTSSFELSVVVDLQTEPAQPMLYTAFDLVRSRPMAYSAVQGPAIVNPVTFDPSRSLFGLSAPAAATGTSLQFR